MSIVKKFKELNELDKLDVLVDDFGTSRHFIISDFPESLPQGRSSFLIETGPFMKDNVEIKIDFIDADGNSIYYEPIEDHLEGTARRITVEVYNDTAPGVANLVIVGELDSIPLSEGILSEVEEVPDDWKDIYNVRLTKEVIINTTEVNTEPIRFYTQPKVSVSERRLGSLVRTESTASLTSSFTSIEGSGNSGFNFTVFNVIEPPQGSLSETENKNIAPKSKTDSIYKLGNSFKNKKGTVKNSVFKRIGHIAKSESPIEYPYNFKITNSDEFKTKDIGGTIILKTIDSTKYREQQFIDSGLTFPPVLNNYTASIAELENNKVAYLEKPFTNTNNKGEEVILPFFGTIELSKQAEPTSSYSTSNIISYADVSIENMRTFSGDVYLAKVLVRSEGSFDDFKLLAEVPIESTELMVDSNSVGLSERVGYFENQTDINTYWEVDGGTLTYSNSPLLDGVYVSGSNTIRFELKDAYNIDLTKSIDYTLSFKAYSENGLDDSSLVLIYASGSSFYHSQQKYIDEKTNQEIVEGSEYGYRFGSLEVDNQSEKDFGLVTHNFTPTKTGNAIVQFRVVRGTWYFSDISVKPSEDTGFSPSTFTFQKEMPLEYQHKRPDTFEFLVEFYDSNNNIADSLALTTGSVFTGGNFVLSGTDNIQSGDMFLGGDSTGSGIHFGGVDSIMPETGESGAEGSGFIRSIGYQGFISASAQSGSYGFMIYSGSVLPNSGDNYAGVGLELVGASGSLKFRTNPSLFEVKADAFFVGNQNLQFISGSSGAVEISSSNFHLTPEGNVTMSGTVTATAGNIGGFVITDEAISSPDGSLILSGSGNITGSDVLFTGGKISGSNLEINVQNVTMSGSSVSIESPKFFLGSSQQFISGSNSNIEISSSKFHLNPTDNILVMSGSITATDGEIGGFSIGSTSLSAVSTGTQIKEVTLATSGMTVKTDDTSLNTRAVLQNTAAGDNVTNNMRFFPDRTDFSRFTRIDIGVGVQKGLPTFKSAPSDGGSAEFRYANAFGEPFTKNKPFGGSWGFPHSESITISIASGSFADKNKGVTMIYTVEHQTVGDVGISTGSNAEVLRIGKVSDTGGDFDDDAAGSNRIFHYGISGSSASTASFGNLVVGGNLEGQSGTLTIPSTLTLGDISNVSASIAAAIAGGDNLGNHTATQDLNLDSNNITNVATITATNVNATTITATSINTTNITSSIVTASIVQTSGSNIFGDTISDTHTFNGHITASGDVSGSSTSTGSFGVLGIGGGSTPGTNNIHVYEGGAKNARISIEANNVSYNPSLNLRNNNADGQIELDYQSSNRGDMNFYLDNDIGGALGAIMSLRKEGHVEFIGANQKVSGSSTSTGSFGKIRGGGYVGSSVLGVKNSTANQYGIFVDQNADFNAVQIDNTGNATRGAYIYSNKSSATTELVTILADATDFGQEALFVRNDDADQPTIQVNGGLGVVLNDTAVGVSGSSSSTGSFGRIFSADSANIAGLEYPTADADDGSVFMTNGSGVITLESNVKYVNVKNVETHTLSKGTPVHATGTSGNTPEVVAASASISTKMPATFVLAAQLTAGSEGRAVLTGFLNGIDTSTCTEGNILYVGADGGYTKSKPTGSANLIQNIATVGKVDASNGSIFVNDSGRAVDVPNLPTGKIWVGNDNTVTSSIVYLDEPGAELQVTGSILSTGNISGSSTSTGSFGHGFIDGKLGINTTSPVDRFHIVGAIRAQDGSSAVDYVRVFHDGTDGQLTSNRGKLKLEAQSSAYMVELVSAGISGSSTSTGSFGSMVIGGQNNANAQAGADTLVVQDGMTIFNTGTGRLNFSDGAGSGDESYKGVIKYNHSTNILTFAANAVDRVSLNPSGVLQTLHVSGSSTSTGSFASLHTPDSGKVGFGTTAPLAQVHIKNNPVTNYGQLIVEGYNQDREYISFKDTVHGVHTLIGGFFSTQYHTHIDNVDGGNIHFRTANSNADSGQSNRMVILAGGNVGIGTTSPTQKLDLRGGNFIVSGSGGSGIIFKGTADGSNKNAIYFKNASDTEKFRIIHDPSANGTDDLQFKANANSVTVMTMLQSGNVGINEANPDSLLHIYRNDTSVAPMLKIEQDGTGDAALLFNLSATQNWQMGISNGDSDKFKISTTQDLDNTTVFTIDTSGNVGIGTTSPSQKLTVAGTVSASNGDGGLELKPSSRDAILTYTDRGTDRWNIWNDQDLSGVNNVLRFDTSLGSSNMVIKQSGEVGIGETSPSYPLHVSSTDSAIYLVGSTQGRIILQDSGATSNHQAFDIVSVGDKLNFRRLNDARSGVNATVMTFDSDNVGIGTTGPNTLLEVGGTSAIRSTYTGTSSAGVGGTLQLVQDDGAAIESGHRLGVIVFGASEDASNTIHFGAGISAFATQLHSATQNGTKLAFEVTADGATSRTTAMTIFDDGNVGIGISLADGRLHVSNGLAGSVTAHANADELIVENSTHGGISILTPDSTNSNIYFGSPSDNKGAEIVYGKNDGIFLVGTSRPGHIIKFRSDDQTDAMVIDASQKVGIGTTAIPHGGVGAAKFAIDGTTTSTAGPHIQYTTAADDYPLFQQLNWEHDNISMQFDSYYDGAWRSSDAGSNFQIYKHNDILDFRYDSGIAQGSAITWNTGFKLDTSGDVTFESDIKFADNGKALFGNSNDLQIYHNGTHSYINEGGTGNLIIYQGSDTAVFSPTTITLNRDVTVADTKTLGTSTFISGITGDGFRIEDNGSDGTLLEIDNIVVRNTLRTHIFQKDVVKATNGILFISDSGVISGSTDNGDSTGTVTFSDDKSATFNLGDRVLYKDLDEASGTIKAVSFRVTGSGIAAGSGFTKYGVDSASGSLSDLTGSVGGTAVRVSGGTLALDASSANSPYMDVNSSSGSAVVRTGNLAGITSPKFGTLSGFGLWASGSAYLEGAINATSGEIGGYSINATTISSSNNNLILRNTGEITGSTVLFDGGKIGEFTLNSVGLKSSDGALVLSGSGQLTASAAQITGKITAETGTIGGFNIGTDLDASSGTLKLKGASGQLTASAAQITGKITAETGTIGGFNIGSDLDASSGTLKLKGASGQLTASAAQITGKVTAQTGTIGGFNIGTNLESSGGTLNLKGATGQITGSDVLFDGGKIGGFNITATKIRQGSNINLDSSNKYLAINDTTFGNTGIQLQYNSGTPRAFIGKSNGGFFKFDGSDLEISSSAFMLGSTGSAFVSASSGQLEISSSNFQIAPNGDVNMSGTITSTAGTIGGFTIGSNVLQSINTSGGETNSVKLQNTGVIFRGDDTSASPNTRATFDISAENVTPISSMTYYADTGDFTKFARIISSVGVGQGFPIGGASTPGASMRFEYNNAFGEPTTLTNPLSGEDTFPLSESIRMTMSSGSGGGSKGTANDKNAGVLLSYHAHHQTSGDVGIKAGPFGEVIRIGKVSDTDGDFDDDAAAPNRIFHYGISGSVATTASFGTYFGDGSNLTGLGGGGSMSTWVLSDGATTQTIDDGETVTFSNVANETTVAVSATNTVTIGLPNDVTLAGELTTGNGSQTTPAISLGSSDDGFYHDTSDGGIGVMVNNAYDFLFKNGGDFHADADVIAFSSTTSDERLKDDVETLELGLDKIKNLRGVEFTWNKGSKKGKREIGVIAQEVEKVLPEIVTETTLPLMDDSGTIYKTVDYDRITAVLIEAVKEQQTQIDELKKEVEVLKNGSS